MAEFSDKAMERPPEDQLRDDFMQGKHVTKYLEDYLDEHVYSARSLRDRLLLGFTVSNVKKQNGVWIITGSMGQQAARTFTCNKLIVAMGLTSAPNMPSLPDQHLYTGKIIHQNEFGGSGILQSPDRKNVVVLGGAKSAADMVYASVKAGKTVTWLVRKSGSGPAAFVSGKGKGPYKNSAEIGSTRLLAKMSPSVFEPDTWWSWLLNRTWIGRWLTSAFWSAPKKISNAIFESGLKARPGFQDLRSSVEYVLLQYWYPLVADGNPVRSGQTIP